MQVFVWNPTSQESLKEFNDRMLEFCSGEETAIVDVHVSVVGDLIALSLSEAADVDSGLPVVPCIIPQVFRLSPELLISNNSHIENHLDNEANLLAARDSDEEPFIPFKTMLYPMASGGAYGVIVVNGGSIDLEQGADEGGAGDGRPR